MPQQENRTALLNNIIRMRPSYDEDISAVKKMPWDCEHFLVEIEVRDLLHALRLNIDRKIPFSKLSMWANFLEIREDISLEKNNEELIRDVIFELANPELSVSPENEIAIKMLEQINIRQS